MSADRLRYLHSLVSHVLTGWEHAAPMYGQSDTLSSIRFVSDQGVEFDIAVGDGSRMMYFEFEEWAPLISEEVLNDPELMATEILTNWFFG